MAGKTQMKYDPTTRKWSKVTDNSINKKENIYPKNKGNSGSSSKNTSNLNSPSNAPKRESSNTTKKQYNNIELNTLTGTLSYIATQTTIKLKPGQVIKLKGLGKFLSGKYYVKEVNRQISASGGYSHSAELIRTDVGTTLKIKSKATKSKTPKKTIKVVIKNAMITSCTARVKNLVSTPSTPKRSYTVQVGDTAWTIAKKFFDDGKQYTRLCDALGDSLREPDKLLPGQKIFIP